MAGETRVRFYLSATDDASPKLRIVASTLNNIKAIAAGYVLATGLMAMGRAFKELAGEAIDAASSLQQFTVGVETLIAREGVLSGKFDNVTDALRNTGGNVEQLNNRLKELSLTSMAVFPVETIQGVWRLNMAYGATSEQSIDLTKAILSTSAALGLTTEMVQRLNYNLAQAVVAGDLSQINLRQLKLASLDLARILQEELGLSIQQIRDQLKAGQITLQEVSEAFVKYAEENFGTAAERMRNTLKGAAQEIRNLFYWAGVDTLTPSIEAVTDALKRFSAGMKGLIDAGFFVVIGEEVGKMTAKVTTGIMDFLETFARGFRDLPAQVYPPLEQIMAGMGEFGSNLALTAENAADEFGDSFGYKMGQIARKAIAWGANISTGIALGLVRGAVATLVWAMNFITDLLTYWLGPGSPPRVAPDIDKWGAATFTEWLHGFQEADWGIFNSLARQLKSVFSTLLDIEAIDEETFAKELITYTKDLASSLDQFIKTGVMSNAIFEKLREIGGEFGEELELLLRKQFDLARATEEFNKITKAFEDAEKAQKAAREELERLTAEYDELVATRAPKILVRQKKAEMDAARARSKAADEDLENLERQRDAVEERIDALKRQVQWQENIIDQLREMYEWQYRLDQALLGTIDKLGKIKAPKVPKAKKGAKGAEEEGLLEYPIPDFETLGETAKQTFDGIRAELRNLIPEEAWTNIDLMKQEFAKLKTPWETLKTKINEALTSEKFATFKQDLLDLIPEGFVDDVLAVGGGFLVFAGALTLARIAAKLGLVVFHLLGGKWLLLVLALALLKKAWDEDWGGMKTTILQWWEDAGPIFEKIKKAIEDIKKAWDDFWGWVKDHPTSAERREWLSGKIEEIQKDIMIAPLGAGAKTWTFEDWFGRIFGNAPMAFESFSWRELWGTQDWLESMWDDIFGAAGEQDDFWQRLHDLLLGADPELSKNNLINEISGGVSGVVEGVLRSQPLAMLGGAFVDFDTGAAGAQGELWNVTQGFLLGDDPETNKNDLISKISGGIADLVVGVLSGQPLATLDAIWADFDPGITGAQGELWNKTQGFLLGDDPEGDKNTTIGKISGGLAEIVAAVLSGKPLETLGGIWADFDPEVTGAQGELWNKTREYLLGGDPEGDKNTTIGEINSGLAGIAAAVLSDQPLETLASIWADFDPEITGEEGELWNKISAFLLGDDPEGDKTKTISEINSGLADIAAGVLSDEPLAALDEIWTDFDAETDLSLSSIEQRIKTWATNTGADIDNWASGAQASIGDWVTNTITNIEEWATTTGETIGVWKDDAISKFDEMGENVKTWFETKIPAAWQAVVDFWDESLYPCLLDLDAFINDPVIETVKKLVHWFETKLTWAWQVIVDFWNDPLKGVFEALKKILGAPTDSILFFLKEIVHWTEVRLKEAWEWVERAWNGTFGNVWRKIHELMSNIAAAIKSAVAAARELISLIPKIQYPSAPGAGAQFGGYMMGHGLAQLHANEMVLPLGNQIGINALARAMRKAMQRGAPMAGTGTIYIHTVNVYTSDAKDFMGQMQALAIPGGAM